MRRSLLAVLALAAIAESGFGMRAATQATPVSSARLEKRVVTTGLANPFQMVWGPDDYLWVTERTAGRVTRVLPSDGSTTLAIAVGDLLADEPGGLLGMALDPGLLKGTGNDYVYVAYTYDADADPAKVTGRMKIVRFTYDPRTHALGTPRDILDGLPAGNDHQGGRLIMGPDRKLYFTIGDMGANQLANFCNPNRAQSVPTAAQLQTRDWSLYVGKVLRVNLDGSIPPDNPMIAGVRSHIYSYGHRNPQGLVFAPDGKLYESEHGPNTDDEVNLLRAGGNYGWPHIAGYRDDQSYAYANWSASKGVPCGSLKYTAYPEVPPSVPIQKESAWSHPDFTPPIQTFRTVPTGYDFKNPKCAERELYYQCWPTVAPSSLAVYAAKNGIPGWDHSLLMPSLKHGTVYRMQLNAAGTAVVGEPDENLPLKTVNRYRDVTMRPDGLTLFIATDSGGNTQDLSGRPAAKVENPGAILEFRYVTNRAPLHAVDGGGSCADVAKITFPNATITHAEAVEAGSFKPPDQGNAYRSLPAFCRVAMTLTPSSDSDVKVELWIPAANWNGRFQAVGNGAFNGTIGYAAMAGALTRGYATSSTDTGHVGGGASWALGHPEKVVDFGWRAVHEMTVASKKILASHTGRAPSFSYWNGCSAGGRQAMKEAQRFPDDFNGIIAGAPGLDWTGRAAQAVRVAKTLEHNDAGRLSSKDAQLLHRAIVDACDAGDGLKDGLISDPERCRFDPGVLQCSGSDRSSCLTPAQVGTARTMYSKGVNPSTKREIGGLLPGSELGWTDLGWTASARATGLDQFRFLVFNDPAWDVQTFDFERDLSRAEDADGNTLNALDPNLKPFIDRGGKLIQFHGWADPQISPANSTQYYTRVVDALGGVPNVDESYRLFMAPGMGHCGGGEGPNTFDMVAALEQWVEHGKAPDQVLASHSTNGVVDRTRPLCPYPQVAEYKGAGSIDAAANFICRGR